MSYGKEIFRSKYKETMDSLNTIKDNYYALDQEYQWSSKEKDKEIERLNNIINDKKERQDIAIRLLHKLFGTDDYEINYIIGIINGQRQIKSDDEILDKGSDK